MPEASDARIVVMVSSTALDLPGHREHVKDACLRMGMFPAMMEQLPAADADAVAESRRLVDSADVYLGVFAFRYGYVPEGSDISITEMEYDRAVERGIPRLIFLMRDDYLVKPSDVEKGDSARKLDALKERLRKERVVNPFGSPEDLRGLVIHSLVSYREPDLTTFHYVGDIPEPPEAFIAHPYTLLQTHRLVGRQPELNLLTDWVAKPGSDVYKARILNVVAVGGMGKSALTWKWFNDIAPQEMKPLAGRMWWSFYESDATFENFVTRALAYVKQLPLDEVQQIPAPDRETQLLHALDRDPFLLVLDGLERILIAYARMDAARLEDSQVGTQRSLRKTADPRVGRFLKKLAQVRNSRILISTRLHPTELETEGGDPIPTSYRVDITGLTDEDAVELWHAFNITGPRDLLLSVFDTFGRHPLLIQALEGEVKRYRRAPGDFEEWCKANPQFDPTRFPLLQGAMSHVLEFSLRGLSDIARQVLHIIAGFRMPTSYDTLTALSIGEGKACAEERQLDEVLTELEDRGLVGWDKRANRYDLHPIVRGVVWGGLSDDMRRGIYTSLNAHFQTLPTVDSAGNVNSLEDLTPAMELYNALIGLRRYDDAYAIFYDRLSDAMLHRLSASRQLVEMLEMLFADEPEQLPRLKDSYARASTLNMLALGYELSGQPRRAASLYRRSIELRSRLGDSRGLSVVLSNLSNPLRLSGSLFESEAAALRVLLSTREHGDRLWEAVGLYLLGATLAARGMYGESGVALRRSLRIFTENAKSQYVGMVNSHLSQRALWAGDFTAALTFGNRAWELVRVRNSERDFIRAAQAQGAAALGLNDLSTADERLHIALTRARKVNHIEREVSTLVLLADSGRRQGDLKAARELLDDVWEAAERGPYPLVHADACCVLAEVERDEGNRERAVGAATKAYELAWCDGPPFAYHWGLERARGLLRELGAGEPVLEPFDESKFEAMPEVEIDPADEFGAWSVGEPKVESEG